MLVINQIKTLPKSHEKNQYFCFIVCMMGKRCHTNLLKCFIIIVSEDINYFQHCIKQFKYNLCDTKLFSNLKIVLVDINQIKTLNKNIRYNQTFC